jgi:hypothetical protein
VERGAIIPGRRDREKLAADRMLEEVTMIHQLRIYEIFESNKAAFHARFRDHAMRIMKSYGFRILSMWETRTPARTEFVYLLEWPDVEAKTSAWDRFMADPEWNEIKRVTSAESGRLVGQIEDRVLVAVPYAQAPTSRAEVPFAVAP